ncbi:MAG: hypothetical protein IPK57_13700 [Chitinophagaceae bacterium]|nr:hypothetical protein [Chitinophagaceae bacterium]
MIAAYDALRFFFDKYTIPLSYFYNAPKPSFNADSVIITHFKTAPQNKWAILFYLLKTSNEEAIT